MTTPNNTPPNTIATPEGDNELLPDEPLNPSTPAPTRPRGDQPHSSEPLYPALD
jgi:hypothetical protein